MIGPLDRAAALPQVEPGALPAHVREAGPEAVETYRAALGFERTLLVELLRDVAPKEQGDGEQTGDSAGGSYRDLVPQTLADALVARGGTGLADELYRSLRASGA